MKTVITFGTFDVFHVGHLRILKRAKLLGDRLVVGVSSDRLNVQKKGKNSIYSLEERFEILSSIKYIDECFVENSLDEKREYIQKYGATILVMGNDWLGRFDEYNDMCQVVYFDRTASISTTAIIEKIKR